VPDAAGPDATPDVALPEDVPVVLPDAGKTACDPPLSIVPAERALEVAQLAALSPQGGTTGDYRFEIVTNATGGLVNPVTGVYLAGDLVGAVDVVSIRDTGCVGSVSVSIEIVEPLVVAPLQVELGFGEDFRFEVSGGAGEHTFTFSANKSGATVEPDGTYTAGGTEGRDTIEITDPKTGVVIEARIDVVEGAKVEPEVGRVFVAAGHPFTPELHGGSGHFLANVLDPTVATADGEVVWGGEPGRTDVDFLDVFTGGIATLDVETITTQRSPVVRRGDGSNASLLLAPGDIDGDGHPDAVLAMRETDLYARDAGAVYVYRGVEGGLEPEPARIIRGSYTGHQLGHAATVGDFDADGLVDLVVTSAVGTKPGDLRGAVYIYRGEPGALFGEEPAQVLSGPLPDEGFGWRVVACDFNGDGRSDLAVSGTLMQDLDVPTQAPDQGAVSIFLSGKGGLASDPEVVFFGKLPDLLGKWRDAPNLRLGATMAAGDIDGDGACDLAVGSIQFAATDEGKADGAVFVYRGLPVGQGASGKGGVSPLPSLAIAGLAPEDPSSAFAASVAVGDVDGDGAAELVVGQPGHDGVKGAVRLYRGGPLAETPPGALSPVEDADWTFEGLAGGDAFGFFVGVADVDGTGPLDVVVAGESSEIAGGAPDSGAVVAFPGTSGGLPAATPALAVGGAAEWDHFGEAFAMLPDLDGDGARDAVAFAGRADALGADVGLPYLVRGGEAPTIEPLGLPGAGWGASFGEGLDIVGDVTGDGIADLVVGSPGVPMEPGAPAGSFDVAGAAYLYPGTGEGFALEPALTIAGYPGQDVIDRFGTAVARLGDFDGDGVGDFAIVSRFANRPAEFDEATHVVKGKCGGAANNTGFVAIFRGSADGLPEPVPAFLFYGLQAGQGIDNVLGDFDFDGDGRTDLMVAGTSWDRPPKGTNAGGVAFVRGRAADPEGRVTVLCDFDLKLLGLEAGEAMGAGLARLSDTNQDGCDEVVVGSPGEGSHDEDFPANQQGVVRVIYGFGGPLCPEAPEVVVLASGEPGARAGSAADGGRFVDEDLLADLVVGAEGHTHNGDVTGGVFVVPGSYLATLVPEPLVDGELPVTMHPIVDPYAEGAFVLDGEDPGEQVGRGLALLPGAAEDDRAAIVAGAPGGSVAGVQASGGARVHRFDVLGTGPQYGIEPRPVAVFAGEGACFSSRLGEKVVAGIVGGRPLAVVASPGACGLGVANGAVYVIDLGE
jgi:hypothetical protein